MKLDQLRTVAVIGAGDMGHGIAQVALMAGYHVALCDVSMEFVQRGMARIFASLEKLASKGAVSQAQVETIRREGITPYTQVEDAVAEAQLVVEAVPEREDIKNPRWSAFRLAHHLRRLSPPTPPP